ncbi:MAG: Tic20 family protein [Cyanobacteria bacterium P01_C01_bin.120]
MTWRGTTTAQDRFFACLPYLLPLIEVTMLGVYFARAARIGLFFQFPILEAILSPLNPLISLYAGFPFAGIIVFILLLTLVVRNTNISHFIRFNTMQGILLDIALFLGRIILTMVLVPAMGTGLIVDTVLNVILLGILVAVIYSIVQTARGEYAEIPTISEAVYMQVR